MNGLNFTQGARTILSTAREEAANLRHEYVGTEHILLAIAAEGEHRAAEVLCRFEVDFEALRARVREMVKPGRAEVVAGRDLPYTSRGKKALDLSMHEAHLLKHSYVGSEHLLLGLLAETKGLAARVLGEAGVTLEAARSEVVRVTGGLEPRRRPAPPPPRAT